MKLFLNFLHVDSGREETVEISPDSNAMLVISIIKMMTDHGYIVSGVPSSEDPGTEYDDEYEIVADMTDADPLAGLSIKGAIELIEKAKERGYSVPPTLTPQRFVSIYYELYPEGDEEE